VLVIDGKPRSLLFERAHAIRQRTQVPASPKLAEHAAALYLGHSGQNVSHLTVLARKGASLLAR
jgi:hypothetical protein